MDNSNEELFKQALEDGVAAQFDELVASCEYVKLNADSVKYLVMKLDNLVDVAAALYLSDADIPEDLAEELGIMWEKCRDYIEMYENCSR